MKKQPVVSIITATYNQEKFIGQCIDSVLAQTYPYWEQIIIDDGSTDGTGEVAARYKDKRIKYIRQDNIGIWRLRETYNKALQVSQGQFIAWLEGDDFWPPNKLEKQLPYFEKQEVVLSWGRGDTVNSEGKILWRDNKNLKWFKGKSRWEISRRLLVEGNFITACTVMCRKDALVSIGGFKQFESQPYNDYPTWLALSTVGQFCPVDEVMGYWRRHRNQVSIRLAPQIHETIGRCKIEFYEQLPQETKRAMGASINDLLARHQNDPVSFLHMGRVALFESSWQEARKYFTKSINAGSFMIKLKSLLGIICSYLRVNLEWAFMILRRPRWE